MANTRGTVLTYKWPSCWGQVSFVGDLDPALHEQRLDLPKTQIKTRVQPNRVGDDLWRKSVALEVDSLVLHPAT